MRGSVFQIISFIEQTTTREETVKLQKQLKEESPIPMYT